MIKNADGKEYKTPWAVICPEHGEQCLEEADYNRQMLQPDALWKCPVCGSTAQWDDDCPATNPEEEDENG